MSGARPSLFATAVRSGVWSVAEVVGRHWINLIVMIVLARLLSPTAFGLVALASAYIVVTDLIVRGGLPEYLIRSAQIDDTLCASVFWANTALAAALVGLTFAVAGTFADLFDAPTLEPVLRVLSLVLVVRALGATHEARLIRAFGFRLLALRTLAASVVGGVVGIGMAVNGFGVWSLVGERIGNTCTQTVLVWVASGWVPRRAVSFGTLREAWLFGQPLTVSRLLASLDNQGQDLVIGAILGPKEVGYYRVAMHLLTAVVQLSILPLSRVALPGFARLQSEPGRFAEAYVQTTRVAGLAALPLFLGTAVVAPDVVRLVFGEQWVPSVSLVQILCLGAPVYAVLWFYEPALIGAGRTPALLRARAVQTSAGLAAAALAAPFGLPWVAAAHVARMAMVAVYILRLLRREIALSVAATIRGQSGPLAAAVAMAAAVLAVRAQADALGPVPLLAISVAVGGLIFIAIIWLFLPESRRLVMRITGALGGRGGGPPA